MAHGAGNASTAGVSSRLLGLFRYGFDEGVQRDDVGMYSRYRVLGYAFLFLGRARVVASRQVGHLGPLLLSFTDSNRYNDQSVHYIV